MDGSLGGHGRPGSELDDAVIGALFSESPIGLHVLDPQLRLVRFNTAARFVRAFALEEALGRHPREWAGDFYTGAYEETMLEVLDTGVPALDVEVRGHLSPDAPEIVLSVSCFRLEDAAGGVLGLATAVVDITERQRARARLTLLERASGRIGTTLDIFRTAQEFADEMVPALGDAVVVEVLDSVLRGEVSAPGTVMEHGALRCTGRRSVLPEAERSLPSIGEAIGLSAATPFAQSLSDLRPRVVPYLTSDADWLAREPVRGRRMVEAGRIRCWCCPWPPEAPWSGWRTATGLAPRIPSTTASSRWRASSPSAWPCAWTTPGCTPGSDRPPASSSSVCDRPG